MPWKREGKTIYKKNGAGKWVKHQTTTTVEKAKKLLVWLRINHP